MTQRVRAMVACFVVPAVALGAVAQVSTPMIPTDPGAQAEPPPPLDAALFDRLIGELDADDLTTRELATRRLTTLSGLTLEDVEARLVDPDLPPETRRRLEQAAVELFRAHPKAGLGVSFARVSPVRGVQIDSTVAPDSFPAAAMLQAGDIILLVHGQRVRSAEHLRWIILSHEPGDTLPVELERGGQTLDVDLPLGDYDDLGNPALLDTLTLQHALAERLARRGELPSPDAIGSALTAAMWADAAGEVDPGLSAFTGVQNAVIGGVPRSAPIARSAGAPIEVLAGAQSPHPPDYETMSGEQRLARYRQLAAERQRLDNRIATYRVLLGDPDLDSHGRAALMESLRNLARHAQQVDTELRQLAELGGFEPDQP